MRRERGATERQNTRLEHVVERDQVRRAARDFGGVTFGDADDPAFDIGLEFEAVHDARWNADDERRIDRMRVGVDANTAAAARNNEELKEIRMAMRRDVP